MAIERYRVESEGTLTVSRIVWRRFLRPMPGLVERVLELNPHLAALPPVLPVGTEVLIPIDPPAPTVADRKLVRLW